MEVIVMSLATVDEVAEATAIKGSILAQYIAASLDDENADKLVSVFIKRMGWIEFLPKHSQLDCVRELLRLFFDESEGRLSEEEVAFVIVAWKETAEMYAEGYDDSKVRFLTADELAEMSVR